MTYNNLKFTENLLKGKIAELIFEQMLRSARFRVGKEKGKNVFTVLHFGYEHILPELAKNKAIKNNNDTTLDAIRRAPDFAVVNNETQEVSLIEVKYRTDLTKKDVLKISKNMAESWITAKLFLATPEGFYFDDIKDIIKNKGKIDKLKHPEIPTITQKEYLDILNKFEK